MTALDDLIALGQEHRRQAQELADGLQQARAEGLIPDFMTPLEQMGLVTKHIRHWCRDCGKVLHKKTPHRATMEVGREDLCPATNWQDWPQHINDYPMIGILPMVGRP